MIENIRTYLIALRNLVIGGNFICLSLIAKPRQMIHVITVLLFYFKSLTGKGRLEQLNPDQLLNSSKNYNIKINTDYYFWSTDPSYVKDIISLCTMTHLIKVKNIFEIGTLTGYTALHFAMNSHVRSRIYTLDLPVKKNTNMALSTTLTDKYHQNMHANITTYKFKNTKYAKKINCLFGDSAVFDFTPFFNKIDLFFIDGAHSYDYVKSDTLNALKCIRKGGLLVWHDYGRMGVNGVTKWVHEFAKKGNKVFSVPGSSLAYYIVKK